MLALEMTGKCSDWSPVVEGSEQQDVTLRLSSPLITVITILTRIEQQPHTHGYRNTSEEKSLYPIVIVDIVGVVESKASLRVQRLP